MKEAGSVLEQERQEVIEQREDASSKPKQIQSASRRGAFLVVEGVVPLETSVVKSLETRDSYAVKSDSLVRSATSPSGF